MSRIISQRFVHESSVIFANIHEENGGSIGLWLHDTKHINGPTYLQMPCGTKLLGNSVLYIFHEISRGILIGNRTRTLLHVQSD